MKRNQKIYTIAVKTNGSLLGRGEGDRQLTLQFAKLEFLGSV